MSFATVPDALRAAGKAAADQVGELRGVDCAGSVGQVATAMPGGNAAGAAIRCGDSWKTTFAEWCTEAGRHAEGLTKAGDLYQQGDHAATGVFPSAAPGNRGPR